MYLDNAFIVPQHFSPPTLCLSIVTRCSTFGRRAIHGVIELASSTRHGLSRGTLSLQGEPIDL